MAGFLQGHFNASPTSSRRVIPPKILISRALAPGVESRIRMASLIRSEVAPRPDPGRR